MDQIQGIKQGKSLVQLAQTLQDIKENRKDYLVPVSKLSMNDNAELTFVNGKENKLSLTNWSGNQLAQYTEIPKRYFEKLSAENPALLAKNVNHSFSKLQNDRRMLRVYNDKVQGLVSDRFRTDLDCYDMANLLLPVIQDNGLELVSQDLTETKLYLKALAPKLQGEVKKGDVVQFGFVASTSDVGAGAWNIEMLVYRLACLNGMVTTNTFRKYHSTKRLDLGDQAAEILSDKTKLLESQANYSKMKDVILNALKPEVFQKELLKLQNAAENKIENYDLQEVVEVTSKFFGVTGEETKKSILSALASGNQNAGMTQWGLANSFTAAAKADHLNYDQATDLERIGGQIIELSSKQWQTLAC